VCLLAVFAFSFSWLGRARNAVSPDRDREWRFWLLGASLFANVVGFFGISYFDQTRMAWYALLAMITAATGPVLLEPSARVAPDACPAMMGEDARIESAAPTQWYSPKSERFAIWFN
jgi:NhaP-type Na+/H+ or K+/H+ antiporter